MTTRQVAERFEITPRAVRGLAERGSLQGHRTALGWTFDPLNVDEYLARREVDDA